MTTETLTMDTDMCSGDFVRTTHDLRGLGVFVPKDSRVRLVQPVSSILGHDDPLNRWAVDRVVKYAPNETRWLPARCLEKETP